MSVQVISPGLLTTIQDNGRESYMEFGVPVSGPMDRYAAKVANLLVGNNEEAAVMEITLAGPKLKFHRAALVAVAGPDARIYLNKELKEINKAFLVNSGEVISVPQVTKGVRVYLSVRGGFQTEKVLGSRSYFRAITAKEKLKTGDVLPLSTNSSSVENKTASVKYNSGYYAKEAINVNKGPEWDFLSPELKQKITSTCFTISPHNNRQAYQLEPRVENNCPAILTQPVLPGTVQLTPSGTLIVLMRDSQTTGGYPRILQLMEDGLNTLAQKRTGERVRMLIDNEILIKNKDDA